MGNSHDEIKRLLKASRSLLTTTKLNEDINNIRTQYGLISEQENITSKFNLGKSIEDDIEDDEYETAETSDEEDEEKGESKDDKKQAYRISGGVLVLHGKDQTELELTTDEKIAFQETMDEFIAEVSDLVDFNKLNVYSKNVEWSGKIIDYGVEFYYSIGEENGVYIEGDMMKCDDEFLVFLNKLKVYYEKFKSKWSKVMGSRKKTIKTEE
jgi:hypothetical protein